MPKCEAEIDCYRRQARVGIVGRYLGTIQRRPTIASSTICNSIIKISRSTLEKLGNHQRLSLSELIKVCIRGWHGKLNGVSEGGRGESHHPAQLDYIVFWKRKLPVDDSTYRL